MVRLVSLIVIVLLVATIVPVIDPVLIFTVNVSEPSVVESAVGVTLNPPALLIILKEPDVVPKSPVLPDNVQYNVVPFDTLAVATIILPTLPSLNQLGLFQDSDQ